MIKNVAIYCRVSTEEQKKFGISVDDQKNSLTEYCKRNKYKIYDYYIDEGVSAGTISKRKEFVRLLKDLDNIDLIIFTKLDRFSRNVRDANNLLVELDKHNTSFKAIDEDDIDTSTADGRFIFNLKVNLAEHERNKDSERINRVNNYKYKVAKTVCSGQKIFGYDIDEGKHLVVNHKEAEQLNELYDYYLKTSSLVKTHQWFKNNIGNKSVGTIRNYLTDSKYIGKFITTKNKEVLEDFCPTIIDEDKFYKVQKELKRNIKTANYKKKRDYIFSGLIICKECGFKMAGGTRGARYDFTKIYKCKQHYVEKKCINKTALTEKYIEDYLKENILKIAENNILKAQKKKKITSKNKAAEIKNKMNKLVDLYLNDLIDKDKYNQDYNYLKEELKKEEQPTKEEKNINIDNLQKFLKMDFLAIYDTLTDIEKQRLWRSIIDNITIDNNKNITVNFL